MRELEPYLALIGPVLVLLWIVRRRSVVVRDYEAGVLRLDGRYRRTLAAGRHWILLPGTEVQLVDQRMAQVEAGGQHGKKSA